MSQDKYEKGAGCAGIVAKGFGIAALVVGLAFAGKVMAGSSVAEVPFCESNITMEFAGLSDFNVLKKALDKAETGWTLPKCRTADGTFYVWKASGFYRAWYNSRFAKRQIVNVDP